MRLRSLLTIALAFSGIATLPLLACSGSSSGATTPCTFDGRSLAPGESVPVACTSCTCDPEGSGKVFCPYVECNADSAVPIDGASDADAGASPDVGLHDAEDYGSFRFQWYGTGVSEDFFMDRDCGVTAKTVSTATGTKSGAGTVAADDCKKFETLATSPAVVGALSSTASCGAVTDDYGTYTLTLVDGGTIGRSAPGCSYTEPYATLRSEMRRLESAYAFTDAGVDAPDTYDAHD